MGPVTEPCRKTLVRNMCVLIAFFDCQKNVKIKKKTMPGSGPGAPRNYRDGTPELPGWSPGATGASQRILQAFFDQIWAELLAKTTLPAPHWTYLSRARRCVRSTLNKEDLPSGQ